MTSSIYSIGLSGLAAAQAGLLTAGHNIANVNTGGYSRQETLQATRLALFTGSGFFGQGVNVSTVRRVYSDFLVAQQRQAQAGASQLTTYHTELTQIDNLFGDAASGLAPALSDFFAGVNGVSALAADIPSRQQMLSSAHALAARFHQIDGELSRVRDGVNTELKSDVASINTLASQLAGFNKRIAEANASNPAQPPNDLLDKRDEMLTQLNQLLGAHAVAQADGSINVFLANGQGLVVGQQAYKLTTTIDPVDPKNLQIGLDLGGGSVLPFTSADISGGALAGSLAYRDNVLGRAQNELGRIAVVLGQAFNDQHRLGQDLNGVPGGDFFDVPTPTIQNTLTNTGTATLAVSVSSASALTASDYRLAYDGANYTLTRLSDNTQQVFASMPQTVDGLTIGVASGSAAAGDSFLIQPTRYAARDFDVKLSDPALIAAATPVRTAITVGNTGTGTISAGAITSAYWASPLASPVTLTYAGATGTLSGFPLVPVTVTIGTTSTTYPAGAPVPFTAGATVAFGGLSFTVGGTPGNGDTFTVGPNPAGRGDNRNAQLLAGLAARNLVAGNASLGGAYANLTSYVGSTTQAAGIESEAQTQLLAQAQQSRDAVSGVNLDEEAANLQKYQQAYQAAGKVIAIANTLFDSILEIARA